ncbi:MAG: tautomerase family protein [Spirochaetales bacterium]|nr:tautomerase family protein [Spirochaetales bacterium]
MPIITVQMTKGRSELKKQELASKLTELMASELEIEKCWVTVLFQEYERDQWASEGQLHSIKFGKGFGKQVTI